MKALEATFAGDTKSLKATDFKITNTANNIVYAVQDVTVDANDATKVTLTTYMAMNDGKDYTVEYDGTSQKFTATNGTVTSLKLEKTQIDTATETVITAAAIDANGVIVGEYTNGSKVTMTFNVANGYVAGDKLYLNKAGDTATVDLVYHKGTYDTNGVEETIEVKGLVITAVDPAAVTVTGWNAKVCATTGAAFDTLTESKIAVGDTKYVYVQYTKSDKTKVVDLTAAGANYTVESSNKDALIVKDTSRLSNGEIAVYGAKEGTSYIIVKDAKANVVATFPITVVSARKAASIELDKYSISLSKAINETATVKVTVKDQYGDAMTLGSSDVAVKTMTYNNGTTTVSTSTAFDTTTGSAISIDSAKAENVSATTPATYVLKVTAKNLVKTLTVSVKTASVGTKTSYAFEMSANSADAVIKADAKADTVVTGYVYQLNDNVKTAALTSAAIKVELKDAKGVTSSAISLNDSDGKISIQVNNIDAGTKLAAGTYTVVVTPVAGTNGPSFTRTFVVSDSQPTVTAKRIAESDTTDAKNCFEFYYEGKKIDSPTVVLKDAAGNEIDSDANGTYAVDSADVTFDLVSGESIKLVQNVKIGLTVTKN